MTKPVSDLAGVFERCRDEKRAALVGYLPAGYPDRDGARQAVTALAQAGADIVEVGVPYTDPLIDGPVVQDAADAALRSGFRFADLFGCVEAVREAGAVPVVMSYWNPVLRYGPARFAADLSCAGGAGMITPDLIPEEATPWTDAALAHGVDPIFLVAPSSTDTRLASTTAACRGFVYAASIMGVTGVRTSVSSSAKVLVERTRRVTDLPICVGLGVSTADQASEVAGFADGVIVGSALVAALRDDRSRSGLQALTRELARGVRAA